MKRRYIWISALLVATLVGGCASNQYSERQTVGGITGAALGGLLGAQFGGGKGQLVTTGVGVLIGSLIGSEIGRSMDEVDRMKANEAITRAYSAPIGEKIVWNNERNNHSGSVVPTRDGYTEAGNYCREFQQTVSIGGRSEQAYGTACRQPDGTWRIIEK